jgi:hypothetical protein
VTSFRANLFYVMFYQNIATLLVIRIIPLALLVFWNYGIYKKIKSSAYILSQSTNEQYRGIEDQELAVILVQQTVPERPANDQESKLKRVLSNAQTRSNQEKELARVLIGIVVIFICCHAPRIFLNIYESLVIKEILACIEAGETYYSFWAYIGIDFGSAMEVTNSSVNIIIYYCLSSSFRTDLHRVFK